MQRHLRIGYNRAARLIEQMERAGMVSAMQTNGNREVLVPASARPKTGNVSLRTRRKPRACRVVSRSARRLPRHADACHD